MNQLIPAILPFSQFELDFKVASVLGLVDTVQVDVCDGVFVASKTEFETLPHAGEIHYELDLMVERPEDMLEHWIAMNPKRIVIHVESVENYIKLLSKLSDFHGEVGISFSNDLSNDALQTAMVHFEHVPKHFFQVMGIAAIGSQGEPFDVRVLEKIAYLKNHFPEQAISVDGSVNMQTIGALAEAGAARFVAGSAVFHGDIEEALQNLKSVIV